MIISLKPKLSKIEDDLNCVIKYVEDNDDENIPARYEHLTSLCVS